MVNAPHRCNIFLEGLSDNMIKRLSSDTVKELIEIYDNAGEQLDGAIEIEDGELSIVGQDNSGIRCDFCNKFTAKVKEYAKVYCVEQKKRVVLKFPMKCCGMNFELDKREIKQNTVREDKKNLLNLFMKKK